MALQLPISNGSAPSASSLTASTENAPYCRHCLSKTNLTPFFHLVPEQLCMLLINQRSGNLLGLQSFPSNILYTPLWGPLIPRRKTPLPSLPTTQRSRTAAAIQLQARGFSRYGPDSPSKSKAGGQTDRPFENLDRPPDDVDHSSTKIIVTSAVFAGIRTRIISAPLNHDSCNSASWNASTTEIRVPF